MANRRAIHRNQDGTVSVLFRASGSKASPTVLAVFACEPIDIHSGTDMLTWGLGGCLSGCSSHWLAASRPAKPAEYAPLAEELAASYGKLRVCQKVTQDMRAVFRSRCSPK